MLERFMSQLAEDLDLGDTALSTGTPDLYSMTMDQDLKITIQKAVDGCIIMKCLIAPFPTAQQESFATEAMRANLFGLGTHQAILGITADKESLTLTRIIDYPIEYKDFKESLEDFINVMDFWRNKALNHK